ncbi:MAG: hypothetical protein JW894_04630 [Bacteroidales bacterium]|nr:hypothetical protein [Bacteroidales bacterium]
MKTNYFLLLILFYGFSVVRLFSQSNYELLFLKGDFDQILLKAENKSTVEDIYWYSLINNQQGKVLKAISTLEEGVKSYSDNQKLELLLSDLYYETGDYTKAKPYLKKYQDNPESFIQLINILEFQNENIEAIRLLDERIQNYSSNIRYYIHLGDNYYKIDSLDLAVRNYEKAFSINNNDQLTANKLVNLYNKIEKYKRAISVCDIILSKDSTNAKFIKLKGLTSFYNYDFETTEKCFYYLYEIGDTGKFVLKYLGISEFKNGYYINSRNHLLEVYKQDSSDIDVCVFLAKGFLNSPYPDKSFYFLDRAEALLQPDSLSMASLYIERQSIYSALEIYDKALECYKIAYSYNAKPEYLFYMASVYQNRLEDPNQALRYYNTFIESLPPKKDSDREPDENQNTASLRKLAEDNITALREELFFKCELEE